MGFIRTGYNSDLSGLLNRGPQQASGEAVSKLNAHGLGSGGGEPCCDPSGKTLSSGVPPGCDMAHTASCKSRRFKACDHDAVSACAHMAHATSPCERLSTWSDCGPPRVDPGWGSSAEVVSILVRGAGPLDIEGKRSRSGDAVCCLCLRRLTLGKCSVAVYSCLYYLPK